jgi:hypothetical protein
MSTLAATRHGRIAALAIFAGALLLLIGVRFLLVPESAGKTFGLTPAMQGNEMHYVIGLRDVWLGALAVAFAVLAEWRALSLWLLFAVAVCWGDAAIVASGGGPALAVVFHVGSGVFCLALGIAAWRVHAKYEAGPR